MAGSRPSKPGGTSNVVPQLIDALGRRIIRGDVPVGEPLPIEERIGEEFDASRSAVREAVKTLAGKNLVRTSRRVGTIVEETDDWNLLDPQIIAWMLSERPTRDRLIDALAELRMIIEPEAAALAATRASIPQVLKLFATYENMVTFAEDTVRAAEHDVEFHRAVLAASGNMLLNSFARGFGLLLSANFELSIQVNSAFIRNLKDHLAIAEAIRDRNPNEARAATLRLLTKNAKDLDEIREHLAGRTTPIADATDKPLPTSEGDGKDT